MPTVEQNLFLWGKADGWKDDGDKWSVKWGSTELEWSTSIFPRIRKFLPAPTILEIAPGFGRWTQFLKGFCDQLIAVDVSPACIERCKERFASDSHVRCYVNDGRSLPMVEDASVDFAFSFDSLVHVEADVIAAYLNQLGKKLKPDGFAFLHHSNLGAYRNSIWLPKTIGRPQAIGDGGKSAPMSRGLWLRRRAAIEAHGLGAGQHVRQSRRVDVRESIPRSMRFRRPGVQVPGTRQLEPRPIVNRLFFGRDAVQWAAAQAAAAHQKSSFHGLKRSGHAAPRSSTAQLDREIESARARARLRLFRGHQFDPAILRATFGRVIGGDEVGFAVPVWNQPVGRNPSSYQILDHGVRTAVG